MDANFNRAREALRTMEEFARFILDDPRLSAKAKALRHRLCSAAARFDRPALLAGRDSATDVGRGLTVEGQQQRKRLEDCFTAAAMRLSEALRVLAEFSQAADPAASAQFEAIRFDGYSLEKDIASRFPAARFRQVRLYVLLTATPDREAADILKLAEAIARGGADAIQLRAKGLNDRQLCKLSGRFVEVCREHGALSIINDRADIAALCGADGLHLGQDDLAVADARRLLLKPALVGLSTHNPSELRDAIDQQADYVGIGPMFPSRTKPGLKQSGLDYARTALEMLKPTGIGHVAIGGIELDNLDPLFEAGIRAVAVGAAICLDSNPQKQTRMFKDKISKMRTLKEENPEP